MVSVSDEAFLADVTMDARPNERCAPRAWLSGPLASRPGSRMVLEAWDVPHDGCPVVFVGDNMDVRYARMKWPDKEVPSRVHEVLPDPPARP